MIAIHPAKLMYVKPRDPSGQRAVSLESMGASKQPLLWDLSGMNAFLTVALDEKWAERLYGAADLSRSFFVEATTCRPPEPTHRASDGTLETLATLVIVRKGSPPGPTVAAERLLETIETDPGRAHLDLSPTGGVALPRGFGSATAQRKKSRIKRAHVCVHSRGAFPVALASSAPARFQVVRRQARASVGQPPY